jgi:SAM-dependent methyltransferase
MGTKETLIVTTDHRIFVGPAVKRYVISQFHHPRGPMGRLAGWIMASRGSNRKRNAWTIDLLDLQPTHRVLEIGHGPGLALELACRRISRGQVIGFDHSQAMHDMARARNGAAIEAGRLKLRVGSVDGLAHMPDPDLAGPFDRVFGVNVVMFWNDPAAVLRVLQDRLAPGGWLALTHQPRCGQKTDAAARATADEVAEAMRAAWLTSIRIEYLTEVSPMAVCVIGVRSGGL